MRVVSGLLGCAGYVLRDALNSTVRGIRNLGGGESRLRNLTNFRDTSTSHITQNILRTMDRAQLNRLYTSLHPDGANAEYLHPSKQSIVLSGAIGDLAQAILETASPQDKALVAQSLNDLLMGNRAGRNLGTNNRIISITLRSRDGELVHQAFVEAARELDLYPRGTRAIGYVFDGSDSQKITNLYNYLLKVQEKLKEPS